MPAGEKTAPYQAISASHAVIKQSSNLARPRSLFNTGAITCANIPSSPFRSRLKAAFWSCRKTDSGRDLGEVEISSALLNRVRWAIKPPRVPRENRHWTNLAFRPNHPKNGSRPPYLCVCCPPHLRNLYRETTHM